MLELIEKEKGEGLCCAGSQTHVITNNKHLAKTRTRETSNFRRVELRPAVYGRSLTQILPYTSLQFEKGISELYLEYT